MANVPTTPDTTKTAKGPGILYAGVTMPADLARLAITTAGKLDLAVHTAAVAIAATVAGTKFLAKPKPEDDTIDEVAGIWQRSIIDWEMSLSGTFREVLNPKILAALTPGATIVTDTVSTPNVDQVLFGVGAVNYPAFAHISRVPSSPDNAPLFMVLMIYAGFNDAGLNLDMTRAKGAGSPYNIVAMPVAGRSASDQKGTFWFQAATA